MVLSGWYQTRPGKGYGGREGKGQANLIKSSRLSNIVYYGVGHLAADAADHVRSIGNGGENPFAFGLRAGGHYHVEAAFEEVIEDV